LKKRDSDVKVRIGYEQLYFGKRDVEKRRRKLTQ